LQSRFLSSLGLLAIVVIVGLMAGDWIVAGRAATGMLNDRLESTAKIAANNVPAFLEAGQNFIQIIAKNPTWTQGTLSEKNILLGDTLRTIPYFSEIYLLDANGQPVTGYPVEDFYDADPSSEEYMGITLALKGLPIQMYTLPPTLGGVSARLSFLAAVYDETGLRDGVLVGRTDLATNPFFESISISLNSLSDINGEGMLLDEEEIILYSSSSEWVMQTYGGERSLQGNFYEGTTPDGIRSPLGGDCFRTQAGGSAAGIADCCPAHGHHRDPLPDRCPGAALFPADSDFLTAKPGIGDQTYLQR
jgi:hypothetical protein